MKTICTVSLLKEKQMSEKDQFVGKFWTYPDLTGNRLAEGGRRLLRASDEINTDTPLISVITVCWNSAKTIQQTIDSIKDQAYSNIEYIVVDGASEDGTVDILQRNAEHLDYYVSEPDEGLYYAMNKGIELAQGSYILILNSDDWYTPECVQELVDAIGFSGCDFVGGLASYIDDASGKIEVLRSMPFDHSQYLRMSLRHETMLVPAWLYESVGGYDTRYRILSDRDLTTRLYDVGATYYEVPKPLLNFRTSGVSNTNLKLLNEEKDFALREEFPFLEESERKVLNDPGIATPDAIIEVANAYPDQEKLIIACRALLTDRKRNGGKKWRDADIGKLAVYQQGEYPKVSIILPFYNGENLVETALASILAQSFADFEIICVDDCAIDGSRAQVEKISDKDARIRIISNEKNLGLGASRNAGVQVSRGRYIFHIDPDDSLPEEAIEKLYNAAIKTHATLVKGAYVAQQGLHQKEAGGAVTKYPCGIKDKTVENTNPVSYTHLTLPTKRIV